MDRPPAGLTSLPGVPKTAKPGSHRDPCTLSNYDAWRTTHTAVDLRIDFDSQALSGRVCHTLVSCTDSASDLVLLDTSYLDVRSVSVDGAAAKWTLDERHKVYGSALRIPLASGRPKGQTIKIEVRSLVFQVPVMASLTLSIDRGVDDKRLHGLAMADAGADIHQKAPLHV